VTSIEAALAWFVSLTTGPLATIILTIAVAIIGFLMLAGQLPIRRGGLVILGGFILLGSGQIAQSLVTAMPSTNPPLIVSSVPPTPERVLEDPPAPPEPRRGNPFDPYAGSESVN